MAQKLGRGELAVWRGYLTLLERPKKKYQFLNLFWHMIHKEDGSTWAFGYEHQTVGSACVRQLKILAFTRDFKLPEDARPLCSGGEHVICLQTPNDVIFLTADSEQKQQGFFDCLTRQLQPPPIPHDTTSLSAPLPQTSSYRNLYDNTGKSKIYQGQPREYSRQIYLPKDMKEGDVSFTHDYMDTDSVEVGEYYNRLNIRPVLEGDDDYSSISDSESPTRHPPRLPPPRNEKTKSMKQTNPKNVPIGKEHRHLGKDQRLRKSPSRELEANIWGNDSPHYPSITITEETILKQQSLYEFVQTFRSQKFKGHLNIRLKKQIMNWKEVKLCRIKDSMIMVAGLSPSKYRMLHIGDVILKVNNQALPSASEFYKRIDSCGKDEVELEVLRVPNGCLCHATLPTNGRIDCLGLKFGDRKKFGVEVISIEEDGLVFKSHQLQSSSTEGIADPTKRVNWGLVEINKTPVPLDSSKGKVEQILRDAGIELALVFLPMDLVHLLRQACCANAVEQGE